MPVCVEDAWQGPYLSRCVVVETPWQALERSSKRAMGSRQPHTCSSLRPRHMHPPHTQACKHRLVVCLCFIRYEEDASNFMWSKSPRNLQPDLCSGQFFIKVSQAVRLLNRRRQFLTRQFLGFQFVNFTNF